MNALIAMDGRLAGCVVGLLLVFGGLISHAAEPRSRPRVAPWEIEPLRPTLPIFVKDEWETIGPPEPVLPIPVGGTRYIRTKHDLLTVRVDDLGVAWMRRKSSREIVLYGLFPKWTKLTLIYAPIDPGGEEEILHYPLRVYVPDQAEDWRHTFRVTEAR